MPQNDYEYLASHRTVWAQKPVLRRLYIEQFYTLLLANCNVGKTVELGSGPGFLNEIDASIIRTDILYSHDIDCVTDAHRLPFADNSIDNLIGLDVLHHLRQPLRVMREASRVLRPQGKLIFIEPWITPLSRLIYTYLHQETCDLTVEPWIEDIDMFDQDKNAFDGNAAIPYLLVNGRSKASIPQLTLATIYTFSSLTYLLSLGFKPATLLPDAAYPFLYSVEKATRPLWVRLAALRALLIWTKTE